MRLEDFDYALPPDLIAQEPATPRDSSQLMVVDRASGRFEHRVFRDIGEFLAPGDLLAINDTRVVPARLRGRRVGSGGAVEILLVKPAEDGAWEAFVRPGRRLAAGSIVEVGRARVPLEIGERLAEGRRLVRSAGGEAIPELVRQSGEMPLPPYIHRPLDDPERYQTVYAREEGAIAAPTAGLHFTDSLLGSLEASGVVVVPITLHVGPGTFRAVHVERPADHRMEAEQYTISVAAAAAINGRSGRLVAVGTTVVRALESASSEGGRIAPCCGWTDLYILPGYRFRAVEAMVTNFHLPRTTLIMLVAAFAGRELVMEAYTEAVRMGYRFYSFGDSMLVR